MARFSRTFLDESDVFKPETPMAGLGQGESLVPGRDRAALAAVVSAERPLWQTNACDGREANDSFPRASNRQVHERASLPLNEDEF